MADVTAIILTKNEEVNIGDCIASIKGFAERIIIVDCGSSDATCEIARETGAEVVFHEYVYYAQQFNWAIDNCGISTGWIMRIDADERMTPATLRESERVMAMGGEVNGVGMDADYVFMGKVLKYGIRKKRKIILFRTGIGRLEDRRRDPHTVISEGVTPRIKPHYVHHDYKSIDDFISRYNVYATRETLDYIDFTRGADQTARTDPALARLRKKKFGLYYKCPKFLRARLWFLYNYVIRLGFLDGREGYVYHFLECHWYRALVDAKLMETELKMNGNRR